MKYVSLHHKMTRPASQAARRIDAASLATQLALAQENCATTTLSLRSIGLTPNLAVQVADFLETNESITELDLSGNSIGSHGAACIAASLCKNHTLRYLNLSKCGLQSDAVVPFVEYFKVCGTAAKLIKIDLSDNQIDDEAATQLGDLVATAAVVSPQPFEMDLRKNELSDPSINSIARAIQANHSILTLRLEHNQEDDAYVALQQIKFCLQRNARERQRQHFHQQVIAIQSSSTALQNCQFDFVDLTLKDAQLISEALRANRSITSLRLRDNALLAEGTIRILAALESHPSLRRLDLIDSCSSDAEFMAVNRLLRHSTTLTMINVAQSLHTSPPLSLPSRDTCAALHHTFVQSALSLRSVTLANCGLGDVEISVIMSGLATACRIESVDVHNNRFTDRGLQVFTRLLHRCASLRTVDVGGNQLTLTGVAGLAVAAEVHPALRVLRLGRCLEYDARLLATIAVCLKRSVTLVRVELSTKARASQCAELVEQLNHAWTTRRAAYNAEQKREETLEMAQYSAHARRLASVLQVAMRVIAQAFEKNDNATGQVVHSKLSVKVNE